MRLMLQRRGGNLYPDNDREASTVPWSRLARGGEEVVCVH